jgi:hypothetical protein
MSLALAEVRDLDCIVSLSPLTFDSTPKEITGARAILHRIVYAICGLFLDLRDLAGSTIDDTDRIGLEAAVERVTEEEDYVLPGGATCEIRVNQNTGTVTIALDVILVDGRTYALEVSVSEAGAVIVQLGGLAA